MKTSAMMMLIGLLLLAAPAAGQPQVAEVHVIAVLSYDMDYLSAAEFRIDRLPYDTCIIQEDWNSPLTIGSIDYGFAIAFSPSLPGPLVHLGTLTFIPLMPVEEYAWIQVSESLDGGNLVIVDGDFMEWDADGWYHSFNCTDYWRCNCDHAPYNREERPYSIIGLFADLDATVCQQPLIADGTASEGESWGSLKSLYR